MKNNRKHEYLIRVDKTKPRERKQSGRLQIFVIGFVLFSLFSGFLSPLVSVYATGESTSSDAVTTSTSSTTSSSSEATTDTTVTTDESSDTTDSSEAIVFHR
ncbi:hypothetical protein [Enterococcus pingfangensis]|uniref:hypothetical protein n=1 Tax=Enterococcus pingfangensis TaxID=2559924 RepID=UPI0010F7780B|nr:hypothetical protein [Enterococcus pingfangensis]